MSDCIFCKIISGEIPAYKVYEDGSVLAFLDINPVNPGHTLVVPKKHFAGLVDTPEEVLAELIKIIKKIAPAVLTGVGANSFNLGLNNGSVAGQAVPHLHFHIMPRFENDGHSLWQGKPYQSGEAERILGQIKKEL